MMKIALTGASGLVGSRIIELLGKDFTFIPLRSTELDITDREQVMKKLGSLEFDLFLHLAAYTNVDGAEKEPAEAMKINRDGTQNILDAIIANQRKLIYISTDFVFDGQNPPYYEDSPPNPLSVYGATKYEGEKIVRDAAMIVRISYPYRQEFGAKKDFVRTIKYLLEEKKRLTMVTDSLMTPTFIDDIAFGLKHLITHYTPETYHLTGAEAMSPFDAGIMIAKTYGLDETLINPVSYEEYFKGKAKRPQLSDIRSKKNTFHPMKSLKDGLQFMKER